MFFILLLALSALSIAGSAAFFSVYGLILLFNGVSTFVLVMGSALELGKLVATSYLYRYWTSTQLWLKAYLILGIFLLMLLTSMGIFGILSVGYQTDSLPLKQIEQQTKLYDDEKLRLIERKKQIDDQIANLPPDFSKGRVKLMNAFKEEQTKTTERISILDKQVLDLKTKQIQTESHVGPIIYIAKAFGVSPDDATKWLIYLIIFVFDPMAVALTLAVNTAIKQREQRNELKDVVAPVKEEYVPYTSTFDDGDVDESEYDSLDDLWFEQRDDSEPEVEHVMEWQDTLKPSIPTSDYAVLNNDPFEYKAIEPQWNVAKERVDAGEPESVPEPEEHPVIEPPARRIRPYAGVDSRTSLDDLINQYQYYKQKEAQQEPMTNDELWAYQAIKDAIQRQGFSEYI